MAFSTRFSLAVHVLAILGSNRECAVSSDKIASATGTNPAFVRRILLSLNSAGLTTSRLGKGGGAVLAKGPKKISLLDIYRAVETGELVARPKVLNPDSGQALIVGPLFGDFVSSAEAAFFQSLEGVSLKQVMKCAPTSNRA